ncbi:hypothetical protein DPMN_178020 [Dreissena polymorpha]|uniref:Uncharacterized protein n=1 Tax=Dreissena polymorpha TaxID=45954 RepID=A0A9D4E9T7_DREPO|nr:hypothetical protein DPMN_178020 [Dreissena polymorpha]
MFKTDLKVMPDQIITPQVDYKYLRWHHTYLRHVVYGVCPPHTGNADPNHWCPTREVKVRHPLQLRPLTGPIGGSNLS